MIFTAIGEVKIRLVKLVRSEKSVKVVALANHKWSVFHGLQELLDTPIYRQESQGKKILQRKAFAPVAIEAAVICVMERLNDVDWCFGWPTSYGEERWE